MKKVRIFFTENIGGILYCILIEQKKLVKETGESHPWAGVFRPTIHGYWNDTIPSRERIESIISQNLGGGYLKVFRKKELIQKMKRWRLSKDEVTLSLHVDHSFFKSSSPQGLGQMCFVRQEDFEEEVVLVDPTGKSRPHLYPLHVKRCIFEKEAGIIRTILQKGTA